MPVNTTTQKWCVWSSVVMAVLFAIGFVGLAHFWPPTPPHQSAQSIARFLPAHRTAIRLGLVLMALGAAFLGPFLAEITVQMKRIEGVNSPLAYAQLALGAIFVLEFIVPEMVEQALLYRPRNIADSLLFSDMFWLMFVGVVSTSALEWVLIGIAILRDQREQPVWPRWVGYVNIWLAILFVPGNFVVFFKNGPLAWNGLLGWYTTVIGFFIWLIVMVLTTLRAINQQARAETPAAAASVETVTPAQLAQLGAEIAQLRTEVLGDPAHS
jgi:hypothetical protein